MEKFNLNNSNNIGKDGQFKISFDSAISNELLNQESLLKKEKIEIANRYHIANMDELIKKNGDWYFDGFKIEEYKELMSGNDVDDIYRKDN